MDVVEETGGLIRERIITSYELSDYALVKCEIDCLFFIPQQMWVVEAVVIESCALCSQNMKFMFISLHKEVMTQGQLRALKTMEDCNAMVEHGWATKLSAIKIRIDSVIFKARVKHSMNFNSQPDLNTWGGLSKDGTIIACHFSCTAE
jgi:hypothetical protein